MLDSADVTIAGYAGVLYDVRDTTDGEPLIMRILALDIADQEIIALLIFAADESEWNNFRPLVSAMISEIAPLDS